MNELAKLYQTGRYLFHGTQRADVTLLEPRQALNNNNTTQDREPAVFASTLPSMAVVAGRKGKTSYVGRRYIGDDDLTFYAAPPALEAASQPTNVGFVYVFAKEDFSHYRGHEYISTRSVTSLQCIRVTLADMPQPILELNE